MTKQDKQEAIAIISQQNKVKVSFNVPIKDNYSNVYDILIHSCNVATTEVLTKAGFVLSMNDKGLSVDKY